MPPIPFNAAAAGGTGPAQRQPRRLARAHTLCAGTFGFLAGALAHAASPAYPLDPSFRGGQFISESFGTAVGWYQGRAIARMSDGHAVAVGMVPQWGQGNAANGHNNIGLSRYDPGGSNSCWANPGPYGVGPLPGICFGAGADPYIDYGNSATPNKEGVRDVLVQDGYMYVLNDAVVGNGTAAGSYDVEILVFKESGEFVDWETVFGFNTEDWYDFNGAALVPGPVVNGSRTLLAVATGGINGTDARSIMVNRLRIGSDGNVSQDPGWGHVNGPSPNRWVAYQPPSSYCIQDAGGICTVRAERAAFEYAPEQGLPDSLYIGGTVRHFDNGSDQRDWNPVVLKIDPASGSADVNFGSGGWTTASFNESNSNFNDRLVGLAVKGRDVFVAAQVARGCADGIGMLRFDGDFGQLDAGFGNAGKLVFGGIGLETGSCGVAVGQPSLVGVYPMTIAMNGDRIGIVGDQGFSQGGSTWWDPMLAVVDVGGRVRQQPGSYVFRDPGGTRRNAVLYDVMANADGSFTAIGDVDLGGRYGFAIGRFANDTIFADGFD